MSQDIWFSFGGERVREAVRSALRWCDRCCIVTSSLPQAHGDEFWADVESHADRVRAVMVSVLDSADAARPFFARGVLRRLIEGDALRNALWFERESEVCFLLAPEAISDVAVSGGGVWCCWQGRRADLPDGLGAVIDDCWSNSVEVKEADWEGDRGAPAVCAVYSRVIPSVREVLGVRNPRDFLELEDEAQAWALWSALIGEGPVDLEQAIRWCAERLRAQGFLAYERLPQGGRVHQAIEQRLLAARRGADLFDRPRNGFVRAVQRELDGVTADQWRDCVIGALEVNARVDREEAIRLGFVRAQEVYGVDVHRLRAGGRAEKALRSAVNSAVRQGYFERDGAAYLIRRAKEGEPVLRGLPASDEAEPESTPLGPSTQEAAPAITPAVAQASGGSIQTGPEQGGASPLDRSLRELDFPTRTLNWADRAGIGTVRELLAWNPEAFASERSVGRRTVRETRERIEAHLGCSWEEAHRAAKAGTDPGAPGATLDADVDGTTEALTAGGATGWAALAARLSEEERSMPLAELELPARMKTFVREEGMTHLGELLAVPHAALAGRPNLGRKSLNDTIDAVRAALNERSSPPTYATFLEAFQSELAVLEPVARMIVTRRAGLHGAQETLEELGNMLGVTRERVRQIEARVIERLRERARWRRLVHDRVAAAFGGARALPLALLSEDPWWAGIDRHERLLDYVVRRIFEDGLFLVEGPSGKRYLTKFPADTLSVALASAKTRVAKLEFPVPKSTVEEILRAEADPLDPILFAEFEQAIFAHLLFDETNPDIAMGYGRNRDSEIIAFLNSQPEPVPVSRIEEHLGRGAFPEEVLYFKRGFVGLKRHFPDFDTWMERLVPASIEVMRERPPGRQWMVPEIHDALRERGLVPEWLGHWHLASLLRCSGKVEYLGRLRVAMKGSGQEERLEYEDVLEETLEDAGGPLEFEELLRRVRVRTDISEPSAAQRVGRAPFVRLDERRVGLVERDIPGGPRAVAAAIEAIVGALRSSGRGLTPHQATRLVAALSSEHAAWTRQLVTSVLRNEPSVRIDRTRNIGLDEWDDARCPARPEFIANEVHRAGGKIAIAALSAKFEDTFGRTIQRAELSVLAAQVGLVLDGETVLISSRREVPGGAAPGPLNLSGIPAELRQIFEELVKEPLEGVVELRRLVDEHVAAIDKEHRVNEFVDLAGAHALARQCHTLLDRWDTMPTDDRHIAHAAIRYFVSWHDLEHDLDRGGLDDDKQLMAAVLGYLALDQKHDALAS